MNLYVLKWRNEWHKELFKLLFYSKTLKNYTKIEHSWKKRTSDPIGKSVHQERTKQQNQQHRINCPITELETNYGSIIPIHAVVGFWKKNKFDCV